MIAARSPNSTNSKASLFVPSSHESFLAVFCRDSAFFFTILGTQSFCHQFEPEVSSRVSLISYRTSFSKACKTAYRRAISSALLRRRTPNGLSASSKSCSSVCPKSAPTLIPARRKLSASDSNRRPRKTKSLIPLLTSVNDVLPQRFENRIIHFYILRRR